MSGRFTKYARGSIPDVVCLFQFAHTPYVVYMRVSTMLTDTATASHLVGGVASCLYLIRSIELGVFEGEVLEIALTGRAAVRQASLAVVLVSHIHLWLRLRENTTQSKIISHERLCCSDTVITT